MLSTVTSVVFVLWVAPPLVFNLGLVAVATLTLREFYLLDCVDLRGRAYRKAGLFGGTALLLQMTLSPKFPVGISISLLLIALLSAVVVRTTGPNMDEARDLMFAAFGIAYISCMFGQLVFIRALAHGRELTALVILIILAREVGAAIGGRLPVTSRPLNVHINARKTFFGAAIGTCAAVLTSLVLARLIAFPFGWRKAAVLGLSLGVACQAGDLAESYFKRATGRRHSGTVLGPEGGLLDFLDAAAFGIAMARLLFFLWAY